MSNNNSKNVNNLVLRAKDPSHQKAVDSLAIAYVLATAESTPKDPREKAVWAHAYYLIESGSITTPVLIPSTEVVKILPELVVVLIESIADMDLTISPSVEWREISEKLTELPVSLSNTLNEAFYNALDTDNEADAIEKAVIAAENIAADPEIVPETYSKVSDAKKTVSTVDEKTEFREELERSYGEIANLSKNLETVISLLETQNKLTTLSNASKSGWEDAGKAATHSGSSCCSGGCKSSDDGLSGWAIAALAVGAAAAAYGAYTFFSEDETDVVLLDE